MPINYAAVLPHGALVLKPMDETSKSLRQEMENVADEIEKVKPDLIVLSTPHGIMLKNHFAFYHSQKAAGSAEWEDDYKEFTLTLELDIETTEKLAEKTNAELITPHVPSLPIEIRWGEVIPLYFMFQKITLKAIILSHPARRYIHPETMEEELRKLGQQISQFFEQRDENVAVIVSGDWAHTHLESGPYGHSEDAEPFDEAIGDWLSNLHLKNQNWRDAKAKAAELVNTALSCGYTGLMLLDGIIQGNWTGKLHTIGAPTYYGMAVASYKRIVEQ